MSIDVYRLGWLCVIWLFATMVSAQTRLPAIQVNNLKGETVNVGSLLDDGVPTVITFWTTVCKPCLQELDAFSEQWEDWQREVKFKIVAVSADDARSVTKVRTFVATNEWPFTILLDQNQDFKRAMNVSVIPHLFIIDAKGSVVYSHIGYNPGNEAKVLEVLKGL
ncbi:TlpA disulfide reductase family protein [Parapedobacter defluvii]|uniref:TlpA family protein disulfide reductase n=1 Tax=Parapedobacter defluvii TaxID=2045106 RepID=UPI003340A848